MPTRKQRRRRQKGLRHEYEYVYVDDEGHEVEVDEAPDSASRRNGKRDSKQASTAKPQTGKGKQGRPIREVSPPSWSRVAKRALVFGPLIFVAFSVINSSQSVASRLLIAAAYTAFFIPLMYLMDRTMYRTYLKRTGGQPPQRASRKR